jgi:transposase
MIDVVAFKTVLAEVVRGVVREELDRALASVPRTAMSKSQLAAALGRSSSTIDRYVADGMPYDDAGTRRTFDLETCREWLRARAPVRTNILTQGIVRKTRK